MTVLAPSIDGPPYRWDRLGPLPRRGWTLLDVEDLEEPDHRCQACGYPEVRYVHHLAHPEVPDDLAVGCVCSGHLTGDYAGPRDAERRLHNRRARLARLLDLSRWRRTRNGNLRIRYRRAVLVLYESRYSAGWRINVGARLGRLDHPTPAAAIRAAVRHIDPPRVSVRETSPVLN